MLLLIAAFSGCAADNLQWIDPTHSQLASERPKPRGPAQPLAARASAPGEQDLSLVLTASQPSPALSTGYSTPVVPPGAQEYPIDLTTALRLAEVENPLIAEARQRVGEALAVQKGARALLLPTLNIGTNYRAHTGDLERPSGRILSLNESSLYFGGGAGAIGTSTVGVPAVSIFSELTDAIFEPLAATQRVAGARFSATATANSILLEVAELHFELLAAEADLRVRLASADQESEVARLTRAYARAKQGRQADAERSATELSLIVDEVRQAEEDVAVASARLARRLHLDQSVRLRPIAPVVEMVTIVDPEVPLPNLIAAALGGRPEVGAKAAAIASAESRYKQERCRPLLPTIWFGMSAGAFGGGSNLYPPELSHFGGRTDFDAQVYWTLSNLGIGNLALQKRRLAEVGQAGGDQARMIAAIRTEVSSAYAEVVAARRQVELTTRQLQSAEQGFQGDLGRIRNTVGRPIEVVNSLELLNEARVDRIRAVTDFNKAEFRLFVAMGSPPPLGESANAPIPAAPIATPPLPPLAAGAGPAKH